MLEESYDLTRHRLSGKADGRSTLSALPVTLKRVLSWFLSSERNIEEWRMQHGGRTIPPWRNSPELFLVLHKGITDRLQQYPTSIEHDEALLQSSLPRRVRMAVEVRIGEKKVLHDALAEVNHLASGGSNEFEDPESDFEADDPDTGSDDEAVLSTARQSTLVSHEAGKLQRGHEDLAADEPRKRTKTG